VLAFLESTYQAAAELGKWDRAWLERNQDDVQPSERVPGDAAHPRTAR
jgi:hypothetical protein